MDETMIQVMTKQQAEERGLFTKCPITGARIPFTTWRIELSEKDKQEQEKMVASGQIPF